MNRFAIHALASSLLLGMGGALAQTAPETQAAARRVEFSIGAQPMGKALNEFATQADVRIVFYPSVVEGLVAPELAGSYSPEEALRILLGKSELRYQFMDERTVRIGGGEHPSSTAEEGNAGGVMLLAQANTSADQATSSDSARAAQDASAAAENSQEKLDEIVVTALKRENQSRAEVPASVAVIDGGQIERYGAESVTDFLQLTPGLSLDRTGTTGAVQIQIRGTSSRNGAATVGYYMDGLPFSFINLNWLPDPSPFDLDRVEVLRGPQGTLYGVGSSAGVVLIKSQDPNFDGFGGKVDVSGSTINGGGESYSLSGALNVPLVEDRVALRGAISYQDNAGWIDDQFVSGLEDLNDETRMNGRLKLLAKLTDELSITLLAVSSQIDRGFTSDIADKDGRIARSLMSYDIGSDVDYDQYGATAEYRFPGITLLNTAGYIDYRSNTIEPNSPSTSFPSIYTTQIFTDELRLSSTDSQKLSWVVGAFYKDARQVLFQDASQVGLSFNADDHSDSEQISVFADAVYPIWDDRLELGAGVSYFEGKTRNVGNLAPAIPTPVISEVDTDIFSPQVTLSFHPTADSTVYARYAKGFRAGLIDFSLSTFFAQLSIPGVTGTVGAEKLDSYELGVKGSMFDRRLYTEIALFLNDKSDTQQTTQIIDSETGTTVNTIGNVGDSRARGVEFTVEASLATGLDMRLSGSYTDAEVIGNVFAQGADPATSEPLFSDGSPLYLIPRWSLSNNISYSRAIGGGGLKATVSANTQYTSKRPLPRIQNTPLYGDDILRTDVRLEVGRDTWSVYAFALNVNDEQGAITPTPLDFAGTHLATRLQPRTIGLGFRSSF